MPFFIQRNNNIKKIQTLTNKFILNVFFYFGKNFQEIKPRKEKAKIKIKERIENEKDEIKRNDNAFNNKLLYM